MDIAVGYLIISKQQDFENKGRIIKQENREQIK